MLRNNERRIVAEFLAVCLEATVDPEVALESEAVQAALRRKASAEELRAILAEEF